MNNKLISFGLLLSILCTTNIVFGMTNPFADGFVVQVISTVENQYSIQNINKQGELEKSLSLAQQFQPTHTGKLNILTEQSNQLTLSYTDIQSRTCTNSPITIPNEQLKAMLDNNQKTRFLEQKLIIQDCNNFLRIQVELDSKSLEKYLTSKNTSTNTTPTTLTQNNQSSYSWLTLIGCGVGIAAIVAVYFYFRR